MVAEFPKGKPEPHLKRLVHVRVHHKKVRANTESFITDLFQVVWRNLPQVRVAACIGLRTYKITAEGRRHGCGVFYVGPRMHFI